LKLIRRRFPEATLCLCTNGLNLPNALPELIATRVTHLTVTINGVDPSIVARIQSHITHEGRTYHGAAAAEILMRNQISGLTSAVREGVFVKVNAVVVPEINGPHIAEIARTVSRLGATVFNPVPLIPRGGFRDMDKPTDDYMNRVRSQCGAFIPVFRHCKQCRADAEGIPGKEAAL
jgi:nitrogen fixation protein NifB